MLLFVAGNLTTIVAPASPFAVEIISSTLSPYVELFEMDCTSIPGLGNIYYFTTNKTPITYGNIIYQPFPLKLSGIDITSDGAPARPTIEISNISNSDGSILKFIGSLAFLYQDIIGAKITYIRTFSDYLNINNSRISGPPLKFFIAKKTSHNKLSLAFELRSFLDKERAYLPKRQMLKRDFPGLGLNKNIQ